MACRSSLARLALRTHPRSKRLQTRRDPFSANQRRPIHLVSAVRPRTEHMLVCDVHGGHGYIVVLGELADVSRTPSGRASARPLKDWGLSQ